MKPDIIEELFKMYYNDALLYIISLCKNKTIAEDIVSTSFFKALANADDNTENFKAWLFTVCRNEFLTICRKKKHLSDKPPDENLIDENELVIEKIIKKEEYKALYHAISLLPEKQREIVILFYFSGMSVKAIANITEKNENNIKVLLHRSRKHLKKILEENV